MKGRVFAVPVSCSFTDTLAQKFATRYANDAVLLSQLLFLVPNRRTAMALKEAFIRFNGLKPLLLPRILPVGDIGQDDVFFLKAETKTILEHLPPAIDPYERLFLFTKLILSRPQTYGLPTMTVGQALSLAGDLAKLADTMIEENLIPDDLKKLVPDQYAAHWQETLRFLQIIMANWPEILKERGVIDPIERQTLALRAQISLLRENPPSYGIIAAGVSGATPALTELLCAVSELERGEIYLYQLDRFLEEDVWQQLDETHPQFAHKELLKALNLTREDIPDCAEPKDISREKLVSETMRPAFDTWKWLDLRKNPLPREAVSNLKMLNCTDSRQEALSIALIMRETLNTPEKTAALVTSDRSLARRVASELARWNIKIDDSAGKPLHLTPVGIFLRLILNLPENHMSDAAMLSLLKHPLTSLNEDRAELRRTIRKWEKQCRTPVFDREKQAESVEFPPQIEKTRSILQPLLDLYEQPLVSFKALVETHIAVAERLAGVDNLWRGEDGRSAAALFSRLLPSADVLGQIEPHQYLSLITEILATETVRLNYNSHPRLKILGPIEARFNHFDTMIIGGVNEGIWPETTSGDPWLSRPMKREFGMPLPERRIGVMAADFSQFLCAPEVYVTRAARVDGTPMNKSRWLLRLETVLDATGFVLKDLRETYYTTLADMIDRAQKNIRAVPPSPCPSVALRPRNFSASSLEVLMSDPYEFFAGYILKLKELNELDPKPSAADYGSLVHGVLEKLMDRHPNGLPDKVLEEMLQLGREAFETYKVAPEIRAFWWPLFQKTAVWFVAEEARYRVDIVRSVQEVQGHLVFEAPEGPMILSARADRLDLTTDGTINVLDYKTGKLRTSEQIRTGYAPQLPLEGMIAARGGFTTKKDGKTFPPAPVSKLIYWQLGRKEQVYQKDIEALLENVYTRLTTHLAAFDLPTTPYAARPNPKYALSYPKYEHLARVKEWNSEEDND